MVYLPLHLIGTSLNGLFTLFDVRRYRQMLMGIGRGNADCFR
jgi:hypothetical protein